jgi:hypothetical protein
VQPAGEVNTSATLLVHAFPKVDRRRDTLTVAGGRSVKTCREPTDVAELGRGTRLAVLCGRERVLELYDANTLEKLGSAPAGIGPTALATDLVDILYVVDALGESLLVYHQKPLELLRRVHLGGGPYAIAFDRERWGLWITLNARNQVVNYAAGIRPVIRDTLPSLRDARRVSVGEDTLTVVNARRDVQVVRLRSR